METQVKLEIRKTSNPSSVRAVAKLVRYMSGVGAIIFEEQFELIGVSLSIEIKDRVKLFSQAEPEFFSSLEIFDEKSDGFIATFILGWNVKHCVEELTVILNLFGDLDFEVSIGTST